VYGGLGGGDVMGASGREGWYLENHGWVSGFGDGRERVVKDGV
jgi:hypothetical protein